GRTHQQLERVSATTCACSASLNSVANPRARSRPRRTLGRPPMGRGEVPAAVGLLPIARWVLRIAGQKFSMPPRRALLFREAPCGIRLEAQTREIGRTTLARVGFMTDRLVLGCCFSFEKYRTTREQRNKWCRNRRMLATFLSTISMA